MEKLRFKDEDGNQYPKWENNLLGHKCNITTGKLDANVMTENGQYPFFTCSKETFKVNNYAFEGKAIIIAGNGDVGHIRFFEGRFNAYQRTYVLQHFDQNYQYLIEYLNRFLPLKIESETNIGAMPFIRLSTLADMPIELPVYYEQEKIGGFLSTFDKLIDKQNEKIGLLKELKKGYLQKMFPKNDANVPEIRFKGFTDAWELRKFKEIFVKLQNNSLSRADLKDEKGVAMNVHYGDVLIKFNEILDLKNEILPYITDSTVIEKYKSSFLQNGDIIIADAAEDNTVGKCCEISGISQEIVLSGLHTIPCRPSIKFASGYLGYFMNSNLYHNQLLPLIQGSKISSISINTLSNTVLLYPKSIEEQVLISKKFIAIDNLITLHQRKLDQLENLKKGYMQRLFA